MIVEFLKTLFGMLMEIKTSERNISRKIQLNKFILREQFLCIFNYFFNLHNTIYITLKKILYLYLSLTFS